MPRIRAKAPLLLALLLGLAAGIFVAEALKSKPAHADDAKPAHAQALADVKAPIQEIVHCPLAFAGVHLLKDLPEHSQVAYHYCKSVNNDVTQCVLYDGIGPDAKLIGIEYLVSDALYQKMPPEEKSYWHDHKYEVDSGMLQSMTQTGADEEKTLAVVKTLWGKVFHTWATGKTYPSGPPRLFWAVTGEEPFVLSPGTKLPPDFDERQAKRRKK